MHSTKKKKRNIWRFLSYVKPYWYLITLGSIGGIIKSTFPLIAPAILRYFIDDVLSPTSILTLSEKRLEIIKWVVISLVLHVLIYIPFVYLRHFATSKAGHQSIFDLRYDLFKHIQKLSASYYSKYQSGAIVARLTSDINQAQNMIGSALTNVWMDGSAIVVLLFVMLRINWRLTLISLFIMPFYLIITKYLSKRIRITSRRVQDEIAFMQGSLQEKISGYTVVQCFAQESYEQSYFSTQTKQLCSDNIEAGKWNAINFCLVGFLTGIAPVIVVFAASLFILQDVMSVGDMVLFYSYLGHFYTPINRFAELTQVYSTSIAAIDRIFEIFDIEPDICDAPNAINYTPDMKTHILFKDVCFAYPGEEKHTLDHVNLVIEEGKTVAIVGGSGAGKSTLISLISRLYDPLLGEIIIGEKDIKDYKLKSLRQSIGMVLQETILFSGTLRENIRYGNPKASDKQILEALKFANAYDFVMQMPEGLDTFVGERGVKLSGGQKQRLAIARAFIKNPKILILDEATSALDSESEFWVQEALKRLMKDRTTIVIAHRLSTVINADKIIVMDKGHVAEEGTHDQLLKQKGIYSNLFNIQFQAATTMVNAVNQIS